MPKTPAAPPPLPVAPEQEGGLATEEVLRLLAEFEAMESLEPDFGDQFGGEASVIIVERPAPGEGAAAGGDEEGQRFGSLQERLSALLAEIEPEELDAGTHLAHFGPVEEADVEIFETSDEEPEREPAWPPQLPGRRRG